VRSCGWLAWSPRLRAMRPRSKAVAELLRWVRPITLPCAWRWLQLEGRFRAEVSEKAVTNGTFHVVWTRARVRLWPPRPKTSIAACSVICRRTSAIAKSIAVPARDKLTFACAATAFTTALHAERLAATGFRTRAARALSRYAYRFGRLALIAHMTIPGGHDLSRAAKIRS